jgi:hypothetical protein
MLNLAEVVEDLQSHFGLIHEIPVIYFERTSFENQVKIFQALIYSLPVMARRKQE